MYKVKIEQFEGPFDLLLEIIEAKKLPLIEVSLSKIADQFLDYLSELETREPEEIVDFLSVASRLALLKSRELVPSEGQDEEQEGDLKDLKNKLELYYIFRNAAKELKLADRKNKTFFSRPAFSGFKNIFYFPPKLKAINLTNSLEGLLATTTLPRRIPQARMKDTISLRETIDKILEIMAKKEKVKFSEIIGEDKTESKLINFLGVLELSKLGKIITKQKSNFGTIIITGK